MSGRLSLIEFPADNPDRARRFWAGVRGITLEDRAETEGRGWQTHRDPGPALGVHERGRGPGDTFSLPHFEVPDLEAALTAVRELGGSVIHPGSPWAICRDSEGSPFGLALGPAQENEPAEEPPVARRPPEAPVSRVRRGSVATAATRSRQMSRGDIHRTLDLPRAQLRQCTRRRRRRRYLPRS